MINQDYNNFNTLNLTVDNIKQVLFTKFNHLVRVKKHNDYDLYLVNNRWNTYLNNNLYKQLHSIIYKKEDNTNNLVPYIYSYPSIRDDIRDNFTYDIFNKIENNNKYRVWESVEGPMITVFYYMDKWHFITTRCWNIDESIFSNNLSHGKQLDKILEFYGYDREKLTEKLDKNISYSFILVYHESLYLVDYKTKFNDKGPGFLVNILNRNLLDGKLIDITTKPLSNINFIIYNSIHEFSDNISLIEYIKPLLDNNLINSLTYKTLGEGIIVQKLINEDNNLLFEYYKLHTKAYKNLADIIPHNNTEIENYIAIYQKNKITYYLEINNKIEKNERGKLIKQLKGMFNFVTNILFVIYKHFTKFNKNDGSYTKINNDDYVKLNDLKIIKYHLFKLQKLVIYHSKKNEFTKTDLNLDDIFRHIHNPLYTDANEIVRLLQDIFKFDLEFIKKLCRDNKLTYFDQKNYDYINAKYISSKYLEEYNNIITNINKTN